MTRPAAASPIRAFEGLVDEARPGAPPLTRYAADSRDRVRDAVDMVDLVGRRTELRRAGADHYSGLCPFHEERTPSFGISPAKKVYHCFGCGVSGDAFDFVMETEGLDFVGALEQLGDRYGVALEREDEDPRAADRRRRVEHLHALLDRTATFYARYLWESDEAARAREYLTGRGLSREILERFRVGYAPSAWDKVLGGSLRGGWSARDVLGRRARLAFAAESGTGSGRRSGRLYDRFRGRIMFPLADRRGGLGSARGRCATQRPEHFNTTTASSTTRARAFGATTRGPRRPWPGVVVVEGYTDVLALHQAGSRNAVGIMEPR